MRNMNKLYNERNLFVFHFCFAVEEDDFQRIQMYQLFTFDEVELLETILCFIYALRRMLNGSRMQTAQSI